ncbi:MAG: hypothetical protein VKP62_12900 [Candidatus Sericytochromatia bacterium]|nr:hypothetical protein [Candidatus Sericytochromatia bacterium]
MRTTILAVGLLVCLMGCRTKTIGAVDPSVAGAYADSSRLIGMDAATATQKTGDSFGASSAAPKPKSSSQPSPVPDQPASDTACADQAAADAKRPAACR